MECSARYDKIDSAYRIEVYIASPLNLSNIALMYHGSQIFIKIGDDSMEIWCSVIL